MERQRAVLITNPHAGGGGARRARETASFCQEMKARGVEIDVRETKGPNDAALLAACAADEGFKEVIVSGGDGTINEALQGLIERDARLAIWPRGTANVLAREIKMPGGVERAAEIIARGNSQKIYAGCATIESTGEKRYFLLMAGIGLDASIVYHVRPALKRRFGKAAFWYSGLGHLAHWQPAPFEVEVQGRKYPATFAAIGKAAHYGGGLPVTPRAQLTESIFEICLINSKKRLRYLYLLSRILRGAIAEDDVQVVYLKTSSARATGAVPVQVDGELIGKLPMTFEIVAKPIEIVVP